MVSRVTDKGVENNDVDELGKRTEISHSSYIVNLSGVVNNQG